MASSSSSSSDATERFLETMPLVRWVPLRGATTSFTVLVEMAVTSLGYNERGNDEDGDRSDSGDLKKAHQCGHACLMSLPSSKIFVIWSAVGCVPGVRASGLNEEISLHPRGLSQRRMNYTGEGGSTWASDIYRPRAQYRQAEELLLTSADPSSVWPQSKYK